jgi:ATP-dependent Clp protease adaptor protein ClpS
VQPYIRMMTAMTRNDFFPISSGPDSGDDDNENGDHNGGYGTGVLTQAKPKTAKPSLYKVLLMNDDYTPMEFVVHVLQRFFKMTIEEATKVMIHVHQRGVGICGVFTYEVAETKVNQVVEFARKHQHPLQCTMEKE